MDSLNDKIDDDLFDEIIEVEQDDDESDDKENQKYKKGNKAKKLQMNKLKAFMLEHSEICIEKDKELWRNLVHELNGLGPPIFTDSEWKLKWSQHKYNMKRKLTTEIAEPSLKDEPVVEQTVTRFDILNKLDEISEKIDAVVEKMNTSNKFLEIIAESLSK